MQPHDRLPSRETLILVSNREPYEHVRAGERTVVRRPAGGLVSALDPTMARLRGTWVAWGSGSADHETADAEGRVQVPPEDPRYTLRRVWLDPSDVRHYYLGFANSVLWPLCHGVGDEVRFEREDWARYIAVNDRFADAVLDEVTRAKHAPVVWVHDYHFALLPGILRRRDPGLFVHQFWHIPFPTPAMLQALPDDVGAGLLRGILGNDLFELQTERDVWNFLACVHEMLPEASVTEGRVTLPDGRISHVRAFPISVDVEHYEWLATTADAERRVERLRSRYSRRGCALGVCVDRIDYTKGIPERLRALDLVWERKPELRGKFTFILVASPSRMALEPYRRLEKELLSEVARINAAYGSPGWTPIVLVGENLDAQLLAALYRAADVCLISSLRDGMNLVAKEFIACQLEELGVLVLSRLAGVAERTEGALLMDPHDIEEFAESIRRGFAMPVAERRERMQRMRAALRQNTLDHWREDVQAAVEELRSGRNASETMTLSLEYAATGTRGARAADWKTPPAVFRRGRDVGATRAET